MAWPLARLSGSVSAATAATAGAPPAGAAGLAGISARYSASGLAWPTSGVGSRWKFTM
jgi:hypothetical protein